MHEETGVLDEMVLCDSEDPSLTFHDVTGLYGFHVTGKQGPRFGCIQKG